MCSSCFKKNIKLKSNQAKTQQQIAAYHLYSTAAQKSTSHNSTHHPSKVWTGQIF
jgi:hypothetical protein